MRTVWLIAVVLVLSIGILSVKADGESGGGGGGGGKEKESSSGGGAPPPSPPPPTTTAGGTGGATTGGAGGTTGSGGSGGGGPPSPPPATTGGGGGHACVNCTGEEATVAVRPLDVIDIDVQVPEPEECTESSCPISICVTAPVDPERFQTLLVNIGPYAPCSLHEVWDPCGNVPEGYATSVNCSELYSSPIPEPNDANGWALAFNETSLETTLCRTFELSEFSELGCDAGVSIDEESGEILIVVHANLVTLSTACREYGGEPCTNGCEAESNLDTHSATIHVSTHASGTAYSDELDLFPTGVLAAPVAGCAEGSCFRFITGTEDEAIELAALQAGAESFFDVFHCGDSESEEACFVLEEIQESCADADIPDSWPAGTNCQLWRLCPCDAGDECPPSGHPGTGNGGLGPDHDHGEGFPPGHSHGQGHGPGHTHPPSHGHGHGHGQGFTGVFTFDFGYILDGIERQTCYFRLTLDIDTCHGDGETHVHGVVVTPTVIVEVYPGSGNEDPCDPPPLIGVDAPLESALDSECVCVVAYIDPPSGSTFVFEVESISVVDKNQPGAPLLLLDGGELVEGPAEDNRKLTIITEDPVRPHVWLWSQVLRLVDGDPQCIAVDWSSVLADAEEEGGGGGGDRRLLSHPQQRSRRPRGARRSCSQSDPVYMYRRRQHRTPTWVIICYLIVSFIFVAVIIYGVQHSGIGASEALIKYEATHNSNYVTKNHHHNPSYTLASTDSNFFYAQ